MDVLSIERTGFLHAPPRGVWSGSGGKEERTVAYKEAAHRAQERGRPGKPERGSFPVGETAVRISYDKTIGRIVVQFLDKESAQVVKQLPPEELVAFLQRFRKAVALLVDKTV